MYETNAKESTNLQSRRKSPQMFGKETGGIGEQRKNGDYQDYSTAVIG